MSDYISREAAISAAKRADDTMVRLADAERMSAAIVSEIEKIPAADVRPVVRGKWQIKAYDLGGEDCYCSICNKGSNLPYWNFCPNCGADMREEADHE